MAMITDTNKLAVSETIQKDMLTYLRAYNTQFDLIR